MRRLFLFLALFAVQSSVAQGLRVAVVHRINNQSIALGEEVTKEVVFERFGAPKNFKEFYDDEVYLANIILYNYQAGIFETADNCFQSFEIKDILYEVVINDKYHVKIGDHWPTFVAQLESEPVSFQMGEVYLQLYWRNGTDYLEFALDPNGIIRNIAWVIPT